MACNKELIPLEKPKDKYVAKKLSPLGHTLKFIGCWFGLAGLYSAFSVCPFCGQQGCPVGIASASAIGAFLALCIQDWKTLLRYIKHKHSNRQQRK